MKLSGQNILLVSPEPWNHIFVSKHHYAIELSKRGNKVYFLNPPSQKNCIVSSGYANVSIIDYNGFVKGLRFMPALLRKLSTYKKFRFLENLCQVQFDIVWSFDNSVFYDLNALPEKVIKISHIVDLNMHFQLEKAAATATLCLCTTDLIKEKLIKYNVNTYKISHGLSLNSQVNTIQLPGKNTVKAVYVGNLSMAYLDWEILFQAANSNSHVDFVFIGPGEINFDMGLNETHGYKEKLYQLTNTYFLGKIDSSLIGSYLSSANILMLAYQQKHHEDQANPHKLMEYLASGKPIVATFTNEYQNYLFINMCSNNADWPSLFSDCISNLDQWSNKEYAQKRKEYALSNTYENQINRIETLIQENIN